MSYALIAYQTAYLKANYAVEYMTAFMATQRDDAEKVAIAAAESRRLGIELLSPDINASEVNFTIEPTAKGEGIRFGLATVKNVGEQAVTPLVEERHNNGPYRSIEDFCRRADPSAMNRRVLESLIKAGAFDSLGERGTLLHNVGRLLDFAARELKIRQSGQGTLFDLFGGIAEMPSAPLELETMSVPQKEQLTWEKELLGVYVSAHPFCQFAGSIGRATTALCGEISEELDGQLVTVAGMVASARTSQTRDGKTFATVELEDLNGRTEIVAWPRLYEQTKDFWQEGKILLVEGKVAFRGDRGSIHADAVQVYQPNAESDAAEPGQMVRVKPPGGNGFGGRPQFPPRNAPPPRPAPKPAAEKPATTTVAAPQQDNVKEKETPREMSRRLLISLTQTDNAEADLKLFNHLMELLAVHPGPESLAMQIACPDRMYHLRLPQVKVTCNDELVDEIETLLGPGSAKCENNGH